jgi:hypothetical protein
MKKILLFLLGLYIGFIVFMPRDNLYYTFQDYLKNKKIYINSDINSNIVLHLKKGILYYNGMDILKFKEINILPFVFYNEISGKDIDLNAGNYKIYNTKVLYSLFYPLKVFIKGKSNFGKIDGKIDLIKREVKIYVLNLTNNSLKNFLRKDKEGYYYYAKF